ncbi:MAG TPA: serine/threonine-protein kinase, partial [Polyangiaceae bacterium]|nr:serine/threonine-protein kinase [Polyangiaceae bacterium]
MEGRAETNDGAGGSLPGGSDCLEPDAVEGFARGWLAGDELARAEAHIDRCSDCRRCVSELAKVLSVRPPAGPPTEGATVVLSTGFAAAGNAPEPLLPPGTALGRYVIDGLLGSGGMGVVYAAYDPELDRKVALKMLRTPSADAPEARERLLREARAMARLSHPNVVAVHDVGEHGGQLFLAMEFVEGITLRSWLRRASRPPREVLGALVQAGRGLAAAHAVGLVHRDVKPDNVLCDGRGRVCVTDFGLARATLDRGREADSSDETARPGAWLDALLGAGGPASASASGPASAGADGRAPAGASGTETGALMGTPAYMAPELYRGEAADAKS